MKRLKFIQEIADELTVHPICGLLGPRQVGKTTLAQQYTREVTQPIHWFDAENPLDYERLKNPMLCLQPLTGIIVIDEAQLCYDIFPVLRVLADKQQSQFLLLGSASPLLLKRSAETLAGRIGYLELTPFSLQEVKNTSQLWLRGGFPRAYLASTEEDSYRWRKAYVKSFLEQDIPSLGITLPAAQLRRFWMMLANYHGQLFNAEEIGRSLQVTGHTIKKYLDILTGTLMVRVLPPWFENINKRQIKSPKIYFKDSGILHYLLGITYMEDLWLYPKLGSLWEGFALEEIIRHYQAEPEECYFWRTHQGAELDLLLVKNSKKIGFECKYSDVPRVTPSMKVALADLRLEHLYVIYPGKEKFQLAEKITAIGIETLS